ncbi:hypothetical protein FRC01_007950, partial [Tulasnella sp. 417]
EEAYESLKKHHVDRRRIVFFRHEHKRSGGYGVVQRAELYQSAYLPSWFASRLHGQPQIVAVKQIRMSAADDPFELKRAFTKELLVWSGLEAHSGIAKFIGFYADFERSEAWLLSPWEPHGNIMDFIRRRQLEVPEKFSLFYDTIDALAFLHQLAPPVCHGDIKSANVLVNANFRAVFCDFGLARIFEDSGFRRLETSTGFKGSIRWCSPELLDGDPRTSKSDVYAWAWLIMTGAMPYQDTAAEYAIIRKIFESPRPQVDGASRLSDCLQLWELMTRCWAVEPDQRPSGDMCKTIVKFLISHVPNKDFWKPRCPPTPQNVDPGSRSAALLENLGDLKIWKGNFELGVSHLQKAVKLHEQDGNEAGIATHCASTALQKLRALGDDLGVADALLWNGRSPAMQSKEDEAMPCLTKALEIFRVKEHDVGVVRCLERIGEIHRRRSRSDEALSIFEDALVIACQSGDKLGEARVTNALGYIHWELGDIAKATAVFTTLCESACQIGFGGVVCSSHHALGEIELGQRRYEVAEKHFQESIAVARSINQKFYLAKSLSGLGETFERRGRLSEAAAVLEESWNAFQQTSYRASERMRPLLGLVRVKEAEGDDEAILFWHEQAITEYRDCGDRLGLANALTDRGVALLKAERYEEAGLSFEASIALGQELEDFWYRYWNTGRLASIPKTAMGKGEWKLKQSH